MSSASSFLPLAALSGIAYETSEHLELEHRWPYPTVGCPVASVSGGNGQFYNFGDGRDGRVDVQTWLTKPSNSAIRSTVAWLDLGATQVVVLPHFPVT